MRECTGSRFQVPGGATVKIGVLIGFAAPFESAWIYLRLQALYRLVGCVCKYIRNPTSLVFSVGSWLRSCRAGVDCRPGTRSCGDTPPSCAASSLISRRRRD